jgi:beta-glucanase (GH16 family)
LNCNTNSSQNLRLIDGTLAITVIHEKHLNKEYTSAKITTREGFTYGRFEIRAALPKGKMLRPAFFMPPEISDGWAENGQIDIMTNIQDNILAAGIRVYHNSSTHNSSTHNSSMHNSSTTQFFHAQFFHTSQLITECK